MTSTGPSLYHALSILSQGTLNTEDDRGFGKGQSSPALDYNYSPSPQPPPTMPELRSNPVVTTETRPVNQQPYPQPNPAPTMPGLYASLVGR